ncbi:MAG: Release factor glutamine methyltransferase [Parcubacteria group bacterium GW2011_GWF2_44_8]|nr:MAG: Release factor glutamine methyltransferase [Parcubacteria group bacterium GW2011_GWF2_44_8]
MNLGQILKESIITLEKECISTAELDAKIIIEQVLSVDRSFLLTHPEFTVKKIDNFRIKNLIKKRSKNLPIAYITGQREFFGYDFIVNKAVLIPRPETEFLVEEGVDFLKGKISRHPAQSEGSHDANTKDGMINVLDLGTGSGCIIISLAKELAKQSPHDLGRTGKDVGFYATDISKKALAVARKNSKRLLSFNVIPDCSSRSGILLSRTATKQPITFLRSNLLKNKKLPKMFDLILANLPYVPEHFTSTASIDATDVKSDISFEPKSAIFAEDNGAAIIKEFINQSKNRINNNGLILIELDPRNAKELEQFARIMLPEAKIELKKDLAQRDRYLEISF